MPAFWRDHPWRLRLAALAFAAALVALLQGLVPGAFSAGEAMLGDLTWRLGASSVPERRVVIVDIDETSLQEVGPWPWPRATIARLSERLHAAGVTVQAFDIVLDAAREGDAALGELWAGLPVTVGQIFSLDADATPRVGALAGATAAPCPPFAPRSHGFIGNSPALLSAHIAAGHLTPRLQADGVVRKIPALVCHEGRAYPSLALAALWRAAQPPRGGQSAVDFGAAEVRPGTVWAHPAAQLASASLPGVVVPLDEHGDMRVPYRIERGAFASVSAARVLDGSADPKLLAGTLALVGATAFGIGDVTATPLSSVAAGVEVHAQVIAGLLDHRMPFAPRAATAWQLAAGLLASAMLLTVAARRRGAPAKRLPIAGVLLFVVIYGGASAALLGADLWLPWLAPGVFALLGAATLATAEHALTRAQRERLSAHLGSYLPAPVAERLMATDPSGSIQVEQRQVSVLAADIRNFSAFAAHRPPAETAALLHAFYCLAVEVVEQHGGVVENVVGDSVLAVWNAYSDCADHPRQALQAGKELLRATRALLARPIDAAEPPQVQPLALGVGIESGAALVGSFGPARRRAHAALGEPVSVASRLQVMTQDLSMPLLIGPHLAAMLPSGSAESLGEYLLEGMSRQYTVFAPADWAELVPGEQLWAATTSSRPAGLESADRGQDALPTGQSLAYAQPPQRDV